MRFQKASLWQWLLVALLACVVGSRTCHAGDFFRCSDVKFYSKAPASGEVAEAWKEVQSNLQFQARRTNGKYVAPEFQPLIAVQVEAAKRTRSDLMFTKLYFFDRDRQPIGKPVGPAEIGKRFGPHPLPAFFEEQKKETILFTVPPEVLAKPEWIAVAVVGDKYAAAADSYPRGMESRVTFPEQELVLHPKAVNRKEAMDPLVEYPVNTRSEKNPRITLFMAPPKGMQDASEARGVLALCVLASNLDEVRRQLQMQASNEDLTPVLKFAEREKLVVLCWGSRRLWDPTRNWDEMSKEEYKAMDRELDFAAEAWSRGLKELGEKYGIPTERLMLWGQCGAGQYAARLALRVPQYFQSVYLHIPGSFDQPVPAGRQMLWCVTTGELEGGYQRSMRFYTAAKAAGYPIIYKAIVGLGHKGHPVAQELGEAFCRYAMSLQEEHNQFDKMMADPFSSERRLWEKDPARPWPEAFRNPEFYGDMVNQVVVPAGEVESIPPGFRVPLPTKQLADLWAKSDPK